MNMDQDLLILQNFENARNDLLNHKIEVKTEQVEDIEIKLEDLHHSIDIKDDTSILECDVRGELQHQICPHFERGKGSRCKNFTSSEINMLTTLVTKYRSILECKRSGVVSNKQKSLAWERLAKEFNATSTEGHRSAKVLKDKWFNIKKIAVKNRSCNGRGPYVTPTTTRTDISVKNILAERLTGLVPKSDSDSAAVTEDELETVINVAVNGSDEPWMTTAVNEEELVVEKMSASDELKVTGKRNKLVPNQKWCDLADKKMQFLELQEQFARKEHQEKIEFHNLKKN